MGESGLRRGGNFYDNEPRGTNKRVLRGCLEREKKNTRPVLGCYGGI